MIINLRLLVREQMGQAMLPSDYHYALSSAIYRIIQKSDAAYNEFLHDLQSEARGLKFTFSDINILFQKKGDRLLLRQKEALLTVCCHMPMTAEHFINGLFIHKTLQIGDAKSTVHFTVTSVELQEPTLPVAINKMTTAILRPCSPLVVGNRPPGTSTYRFLSPYELPFIDCLIYSWLQKYRIISQIDDLTLMSIARKIVIEILFLNDDPYERIITIKKNSREEQKIRGYTKFDLKVTAPTEMIELALHSGLGLKNAIGMGCVKLI